MASRDRRFPLFDAMRALAALSIFAYHCAYQLHGFSGPAGRYLAQLNIGVPVFFLISGFLLYRPFVRARRDHDRRPSLRAYAVRRAARIVPEIGRASCRERVGVLLARRAGKDTTQ